MVLGALAAILPMLFILNIIVTVLSKDALKAVIGVDATDSLIAYLVSTLSTEYIMKFKTLKF